MRWFFVFLFYCFLPQALYSFSFANESGSSEKPAQKVSSLKPAQTKIQVKVLRSVGQIEDLSLPSKTTSWNSRSRVADRLSLRLKEGAQTQIQLNPQIILTAYGKTEFEIPSISWETRQFKEVKLSSGSIRLDLRSAPFEFLLITPFFQVVVPTGLWVFTVDTERGLADILALKGNLEVASLNSEDKVSLKSGERVSFRGVLEEGEIAYDLLLEGRKIPKGKWTAVEKLTPQDNQNFSIEADLKKLEKEEKLKAQQRRETLKKQAGDVCTQPFGDLGDCVWKKEKNQCVRTRCAADGQWKDRQVVDPSACEKAAGWSPIPKKCNY